MRRGIFATGAAAAALLAGLPAAAQGATRGFDYGVAAGETTPNSALLWTRTARAGSGTDVYSTNRRLPSGSLAKRVTARRADDNTVSVRVTRLQPDTTYYYRFQFGRLRSEVGRFRTAPARSANATVEFAYSGDADAQRQTPGARPFWNNFEVYTRMLREGNHFNVNLGDTIYSDTEVPNADGTGRAAPDALTRRQKWAKYKQNLAMRNLQALRRGASLYSHWDDHEFINDFSVEENGTTVYRNGVQAFTDYSPVTYKSRTGLYRSFRWGRNLEVFFLDERSFRNAKASQGGVCNNPQSGEPDRAPTAPQRTRNTFAAVDPSLGQPVSQACLDRIRDPNRSMLGSSQLALFKRAIDNSTATFKVVMNEVPIQQYYALPYDRWEGYEAERQDILRFLRANVKNVVFLTTDTHATFINDARLRTLEDSGPEDSGISEVVTGPVATANFGLEIDQELGRPGTGDLIRGLFFKPPPPDGVGMRCAVIDQFSYSQVRVTGSRLTVTPKNIRGEALREPEGNQCGPFVLNAQP